MKNLKLFDNHSKYDAYSNSVDYVLPNVSYCVEDKCLHYKKFVKNDYLKLKYNVTSTSEATPLIDESQLTNLEEIIIDGEKIENFEQLDSKYVDKYNIFATYLFSILGEHEVWFKFTDEAINSNGSGSVYVAGFDNIKNIIEIIEIPTNLQYMTNGAFSGCGIIKANLYTPNGKLHTISNSSFAGNAYLNELILPNSLKTINNGAFYGCTGLTELVIPNSVEIIYAGSFGGCNIEKLVLSSSLKKIDPGNWSNNTNLKEVIIPEGVEIIQGGAFNGCTGLTELILPKSITEIQGASFCNCTNLKKITSLATTPAKLPLSYNGVFGNVANNGILLVPYGCSEAYSIWLTPEQGNKEEHLSAQGWTIQELPQE